MYTIEKTERIEGGSDINNKRGVYMTRTYTEVGKEEYTQEEIEESIKQIRWEDFRKTNLPFSQGECLKNIIKECNIPLSKINKMSLHGAIKDSHGFYALDVNYKNGKAYIYIADNGCSSCVVASDFIPLNQLQGV